MTELTLTGYKDSVYTRTVRMALSAKGIEFSYREVNPFEAEGQVALATRHPFGRVPVLMQGDMLIYETMAILEYLDGAFANFPLMPEPCIARAKVVQVQSITDSYFYRPLVRGVFSNGVYLPSLGLEGDAQALSAGLEVAPRVLDALDQIAAGGLVLTGDRMTRADCHLAPMLDYFALYPKGLKMVQARPNLAAWLAAIHTTEPFVQTRPAFVANLETLQ